VPPHPVCGSRFGCVLAHTLQQRVPVLRRQQAETAIEATREYTFAGQPISQTVGESQVTGWFQQLLKGANKCTGAWARHFQGPGTAARWLGTLLGPRKYMLAKR
jgi:hypothetical protein